MGVSYGYYIAPNDHVGIEQEKANIVRMIYQQYLSGMSLGRIADFLFKSNIPFPKGKKRWTQPVLSNLLSNQKCIGYIVSFDDFFLVQGEKRGRSMEKSSGSICLPYQRIESRKSFVRSWDWVHLAEVRSKTRSMSYWSSLMAVYRLSCNIRNISRCSRLSISL